MLAVAGVISVMMAIAVPNYVSLQPGMRLNGATREVLGKLMWARAKSVEQNNSYVVTFPDDHSITILDDKNGNSVADAGEWTETINLQTYYSDVTLSKSGADPTFNSRGTAGGSTTLTISNTSGSKTVTVNPTGNVKIN
jgi:type IV fimbrial biogenesis protein FimT